MRSGSGPSTNPRSPAVRPAVLMRQVKVSGWMTHHAWVVREVVCVFFAAMTVDGLVSGS